MKKTLELWGKDGILLMVLSLMMMLFCIFYKEDPVLATKPKAIRTTIITSGLVEQKEETWQGVVTRWEEAVEEARLREELLARVSSIVNNYTSNETTQSYIYYAWEQFVYYGWSEYDLECLVTLWHRESRWSPSAHNKSSGAHGIPQSLPASKMASHGADYWDNGYTQIRWGLDYIAKRYGSPANALGHSNRKGWY